jgi:acyl-CoA dehydrogenase
VFTKLAARGWLGLKYGDDADWVADAVLAEELARSGSGGLAAGIGAHNGIATPPIATFGTAAQQERWLAPAIRGEKIAALAITEPDTGSDVASIRTRAEKVDGGWLVNGAKTFITNGLRADFYVTAAFEDVAVPDDALLGEEGRGFYLIVANFQWERLLMSLGAVGSMRATLERVIAILAERGVSQSVRHRVAEHALAAETGAAMTYQGLRRFLDGARLAGDEASGRGSAVREVTMAKLLTQRANFDLQDDCFGILADLGHPAAEDLARAAGDARLGPIGGGTDEIMKEILGKTLGL